ncbi:MAG: paraslipin [Spirochaeta sp.]|jgi:regulator of protease activity HflC (stomatin/prohibitin superfamily)|nr:paraslipin [Spirochaeta sp.]
MTVFGAYLTSALLLVAVFMIFFKLIRIVPEQQAWVVEQFGKYRRTMGPGFHLVIPVVQKVAYKQLLKEEVIDVPPQVCITRDNVQVSVDGVLYLQVMDSEKASYGIDNYRFATSQLAQTTMRSEIGKIELDRSFSERDAINDAIVRAVDDASDPWGIKVTRYEIKDITPSETVMIAMEQQVRAEREKRAEILSSEGVREARINSSKGDRQQSINLSQGERQKRINEAEGRGSATEIIAEATAEGLADVARAIQHPKGRTAVAMRVAQQFISGLGEIIRESETAVLPAELANLRAMVESIGLRPGGRTATATQGDSPTRQPPDAQSEGDTL